MKLTCPECRRENEPERIFCHDCGARLDRSELAKQKSKEEDPQATRRRLRSMLDPQRAKLRQRFFLLSKILLGALLLGALVQMVRSPDLPPVPSSPTLPAQINFDLEAASTDPRMSVLRYSEEQVNAYLGYTLRTKQAGLSKYFLRFERVLVDFQEGYCDVSVERSLFGWPLVTTGSYTAALRDGKIVTQNRGGHIGRMPIQPALMKTAGAFFADVGNVLERERKLLVKLESIEFHPETIVISAKQAPQT